MPGILPDCASPLTPSAGNEEGDLAVEGRVKEVVRNGDRDRRIEGEDGLLAGPAPFRSGNIDSNAASVFGPLTNG